MKESGFADINGARLYYEAAGMGEAVVFVHGFSLDTRMWDDQFNTFAQRYRAVRCDLRGFGQSSLPTHAPYRHTDDLKALLGHLGLERAAIIGLSMGGSVAIEFALACPAVVRALVVVDTVLSGFDWSTDWDTRARQVGIQKAKENWLAHPIFAAARENPAVAARITEMVETYSGVHWVERSSERGFEIPAAQRLHEIGAPTLAIVGARDLPDFHRVADLIAAQVRGARKIVLPGVGHMANMEAPARFNQVVLEFLATT
jgi:pimeloyl-ACP methyl ester carboxylesterase